MVRPRRTMPEEIRATAGRLDAVVAAITRRPRADVQRDIDAGRVLVDGVTRPKSHLLRGGERVLVDTGGASELEAEFPAVPVRYRDEHLLVVSKPAGLVSHPTARRRTGTLVNRLIGMRVLLADTGDASRPGIVHRLDAGTSGLMIVASTAEAAAGLGRQLRRHEIDRRYLALVRGSIDHESFTVDAPLGRRLARVVVDRNRGRQAQTWFATRERFLGASLLEAAPRTGRTHQIRVHLAAVGHPVLGDRAYGGAGDDARELGLDRPFLHAWRLTFDHPVTGERIEQEEPLPDDLERALIRARSRD
jgi:23S rRNA pseudouridine1911/1915/1917 synthase